MIAQTVSKDDYQKLTREPKIIYNTSEFCELNKYKVDQIDYVILSKGESPRFALCLGIQDHCARLPFSAPFGQPIEIKNKINVENYSDSVLSLDSYLQKSEIHSNEITLPPAIYDEHTITAWINALHTNNYRIKDVDINYALHLPKMFSSEYATMIPPNARRKFKQSQECGLSIKYCTTETEKINAYNIIKENRESKEYPLRMTREQVLDTIKIVPHDIFIVGTEDDDIAAAIVFQVTKDIAQVIYWGDRPGFTEYRSINYLAYQLIQYYGNQGMKYLDIGPSTENSIPNYGLCDFKESIGCERSLKITMEKTFS